jgi:glutamate formiminotransferase
MKKQPILGCALNLSEGRRLDVVGLTVRAAEMRTTVLDVSSDPDHNRTVLTLCGYPGPLVEAVIEIASVAVTHIDLNIHRGVHPRTGAVDVIPFYPLRDAGMDAAVGAARDCAERLWLDLKLPSFFYEQAATTPEARALPWVRKHAFVDLAPDVGGPAPHPTAGAAVVGARGLLVAYNVDLAGSDLQAARQIASAIRRDFAGRVRALGLFLPGRARAQVSMNVLDPEHTQLQELFDAVGVEAEKAGLVVAGSEIVGLVPRACLRSAREGDLKLLEKAKVLEDEMDRLFAD